jgi:hypothetical protein
MTQTSPLGNMTDLLCVLEHTQLSVSLFPVLREFQMLEEYLDVLKMVIIIGK